MAMPMRVTGGWIQLLTDWLDLYQFPAPDLRLLLDSRRQDEAVPLALWQQLLERASMLPATAVVPALEIGAQVRPRHVGVLGYLSLASHTLGEALLVYQRYEQLFYGQQLVRVRVQGELVVLCWDADASTGASADTVAIAALVSFLRRLLPEVSALARVGFVFPAPDARSRAAYDAFFGCEVVFDAAATEVALPVSWLACRLPHSDPDVREQLDQQARALLLALPGADAFDCALQRALVRRLPEGEVGLELVAEELCLSARTLQRRLQQRGLTWRSLLDRTRQRLAEAYLADSTLQLGEVALLLGFSEQSALNRAFRRWTETTPARWRRGLRATAVPPSAGGDGAVPEAFR
ncbi:AraC family transcriptional regulator [Halopseudomonas aestusnigri]|uniref:AraC family transcriptional regulator n=1 Tax=Halopseudomonas aestusnigri TaxID=857252 RepID=UPI0028C16862|nr:AraC family transcriptional regulator [Halopseudomonas aestusnigri]